MDRDIVSSSAVPVVLGLMLIGALMLVSPSSSHADNVEFWNYGGPPGPPGPPGTPVFAGTCTLDGASPAKCSVVIIPFPITPPVCVCSSVGTTAQIAGKGCAVSLVGAVVTVTAQNNDTHNENIICF